MNEPQHLAEHLGQAAEHSLRYGMNKISHCLEQIDEAQFWWRPFPEMNAIGNLLLHLAGNLRQWIVSGVGDEPDTRNRPHEFSSREPLPKAEAFARLQQVVDRCAEVIADLPHHDWLTVKRIQGTEVSKLEAVIHGITHFQGHVQEIICLTRQQRMEAYQFEWKPTTKEEGAAE